MLYVVENKRCVAFKPLCKLPTQEKNHGILFHVIWNFIPFLPKKRGVFPISPYFWRVFVLSTSRRGFKNVMSKKSKTTTSSGAGRRDNLRDKHGRYLPTHGAWSSTKLPEVSTALSKWREVLIADLGGEENISAQQMMILESAIDIKGVLLSMIRYIRDKSYVVQRGKLNPILSGNFLAYANSLQRHMCALGLERKMFDDTPILADVVKDIISKREKAGKEKEKK